MNLQEPVVNHFSVDLIIITNIQKDAKYDPELEEQIRDWINKVLGGQVLNPSPDQKDFHESLKSGEVLVE